MLENIERLSRGSTASHRHRHNRLPHTNIKQSTLCLATGRLTNTHMIFASRQAGFFYSPSPEFDDRVTCAYCSLELGSWEDGDNPMLSHK